MEKVIFFYSVILISVCAASISPAGILYLRTKKPQYLYLILLFVCWLIELVELHYIVFVGLPTGLIHPEDLNHISYPALRIGISAGILLLDLLILLWITGRKWKNRDVLTILPMLAACIYLVFQPQTELVVWLFYSVRQFYRMGYCAWFGICLFLEQEPERREEMGRHTLPVFGVFLLNICILLEDSLVISHIDFFLSDIPYISERNFSENILWMFLCIYSMGRCIPQIDKAPSVREAPEEPSIPPMVSDFAGTNLREGVPVFTQRYKLTPREAEILRCMADHKSTAEICEELYISMGTVKTHTHNIYSKVNVKSKNELIKALLNDSPQTESKGE